MARYNYKPLETPTSIRLIELIESPDEDSPLQCRIHHVDFQHSPHPEYYAALSYVWGDESNPSTIICDEGTELPITRNLDNALRSIRTGCETPEWNNMIWADAICIDQQDTTGEKEIQIPLMGKIFSEAFVVLIWLGMESELENPYAALECIAELIENVEPRIEELMNWNIEFNDADEVANGGPVIRNGEAFNRHFNIPPHRSLGYKALNNLLTLPWFSRVWTFQESFLAKRRWFMIGKLTVFGDDMNTAIVILTFLGHNAFHNSSAYIQDQVVSNISRVLIQAPLLVRHDSMAFLSLLRGAACKMPSDMIYSLFGLVDSPLRMQVDYGKPFGQVFAEAAVECITSSQKLTILGLVDTMEWLDSSPVPSWVPGWRKAETHRKFSLQDGYPLALRQIYACTASSKPLLIPSGDSRELQIRGVEFDRVCAVASPDFHGLPAEMASQFPTVFSDGNAIYRPTGEMINVTTVRTTLADRNVFKEDDGSPGGTRWDPDCTVMLVEMLRNSTVPTGILRSIEKFWCKLCLFGTEKGRLGSANLNVREGDVVCLMPGGDVPLLLRPDPQEEGMYTFVGECYLHGFMDGEGLVEVRSEADPSYDKSERSWLERLHECESLPFPTKVFRIR